MPDSIPIGSKDFQARNPHLFSRELPRMDELESPKISDAVKRIRQSSKPLMNKLETRFYNEFLLSRYEKKDVHIQAITVKLANGLRYTVDFFCLNGLSAWEVKGPWVDGDSFPKLKMAAAKYPEVKWNLVWHTKNGWQRQEVKP
jgi:hypothetical protein